jgi:hypothetical protein
MYITLSDLTEYLARGRPDGTEVVFLIVLRGEMDGDFDATAYKTQKFTKSLVY